MSFILNCYFCRWSAVKYTFPTGIHVLWAWKSPYRAAPSAIRSLVVHSNLVEGPPSPNLHVVGCYGKQGVQRTFSYPRHPYSSFTYWDLNFETQKHTKGIKLKDIEHILLLTQCSLHYEICYRLVQYINRKCWHFMGNCYNRWRMC